VAACSCTGLAIAQAATSLPPWTEYAQVTRMLGNGRLEAFCFDGVNRLCHIRGKLRKRVWIGVGDIVLLGLREFQDQKADIILKYDGGARTATGGRAGHARTCTCTCALA